MHRSESDFLYCAACGAQIAASENYYAFEAEAVLCPACAVARGGAFDSAEETWTQAPDVADLEP